MKLRWQVLLQIVLLSLVALAALAYAVREASFANTNEIALFLILTVLSILSEIYATWIPAYKWEISSAIAVCLACLFALGPYLAVLLVFISSLVSELLLRWDQNKKNALAGLAPVAFNVSQLVIAISVAGFFLLAVDHPVLDFRTPGDFGLAIAAFGAYFATNLVLVTRIISLTEAKPFWSSLVGSLRQFVVQYGVLCVSALLLAVLYTLSVWHVFLAVFPLFLVHVSFRSYLKLQTEARQTFEKISQLLDARDHYTAVHSTEVADLAVRIGQQMGFGHGELERIQIAAKVHDIGKVAVPDSILLKPGSLNDEEWAVMRNHPITSAELIAGLEIYSGVADAVRHEHERWNGSGYPDGLVGEQIPMVSRVIAAADIYNALVTDRPYRPAFSREETLRMIEEMRGKDLDPAVADALLEVLRKASILAAEPAAA